MLYKQHIQNFKHYKRPHLRVFGKEFIKVNMNTIENNVDITKFEIYTDSLRNKLLKRSRENKICKKQYKNNNITNLKQMNNKIKNLK